MSALHALRSDIGETYRNTFYYFAPPNDRMKGVIVETYKKRNIKRVQNTYELLAKEESCCNLATD